MHYQIPIIENFYERFVKDLDYYNNRKDYENLEDSFYFVFEEIVKCFEPKITFEQKAVDFLINVSIDTFFEIDDFAISKFLNHVEKRNYPLYKSLESEMVYKNTKVTDCIAGYIFFLLERVVVLLQNVSDQINLEEVQKLVQDDGILVSCFVLEKANFIDSEDVNMTKSYDAESTDEYDSSYEMSTTSGSRNTPPKGRFSLDYVDSLSDDDDKL